VAGGVGPKGHEQPRQQQSSRWLGERGGKGVGLRGPAEQQVAGVWMGWCLDGVVSGWAGRERWLVGVPYMQYQLRSR
jgi:hypothetical protein